MENIENNVPNPEVPRDGKIAVDPELIARIETFIDLLNHSDMSADELLVRYDMHELSVESIVDRTLRAFIAGFEEELHDDPSDA